MYRVDETCRDRLLRTPNLPSDDAPDGAGEADNVVVRTHGPGPETFADHQRVPHWDIGERLGIPWHSADDEIGWLPGWVALAAGRRHGSGRAAGTS